MQRIRDFMVEYAYLVTLACVIAVVVSSALYTRSIQRQREDSGVQAAAQAQEILETPAPSASPKVTPLPTIAPLEMRARVLVRSSVWPVEGAVLRGHDLLEAVYWETLDLWQTHAGIDIAGEADQEVVCAADAAVKEIARDGMWGWSVTAEHEDGRLVRYAGLALCYVREGEKLRAGQRIGTLLDAIPCEAEMGPHLHMEVMRQGTAQDPLAMLPER